MGAVIFIEGGGDSKDLHVECRKAFRNLLEKSGFSGRMPRLVACGGRDNAYDDFRTSHEKSFELIQKTNPDSLKIDDLPSFQRMVDVLDKIL